MDFTFKLSQKLNLAYKRHFYIIYIKSTQWILKLKLGSYFEN